MLNGVILQIGKLAAILNIDHPWFHFFWYQERLEVENFDTWELTSIKRTSPLVQDTRDLVSLHLN